MKNYSKDNMQQLQTTKAAVVWSYFLEICKIPHASRHELQLVNWIKNWAEKQAISCVQDKIGNVILRKPATSGYENKTPVILQAHLDMVPQKNNDIKHDFLTDPIKPVIKGEWMYASNTTLGADNGVGMASCLAILADQNIQHGPLEVLLTTAEEVGMVGAFGLEEGLLKGKILINTDSEQEGDLYIGCAGGVKLFIDLPYETETITANEVAFEVTLSGLKGGHSVVIFICNVLMLSSYWLICLHRLMSFHSLSLNLKVAVCVMPFHVKPMF